MTYQVISLKKIEKQCHFIDILITLLKLEIRSVERGICPIALAAAFQRLTLV